MTDIERRDLLAIRYRAFKASFMLSASYTTYRMPWLITGSKDGWNDKLPLYAYRGRSVARRAL